MPAAPLPPDEALRLLVLQECDLLDTAADPVFDGIAALAATLCETPIALLSLVDRDRQWFKARHGLDAPETPRDHAFCAHAVHAAAALEVEDAVLDPRFRDNPLVTGGPGIRFYAGVPVTAGEDGKVIGTVCVIDRVPRRLSEVQRSGLRQLADTASALIAERRRARLALQKAEQAADQLRRLALTDSVTGAFNRRGFLDQASWCAVGGGSLVLMQVDDVEAIREDLGLRAVESVMRAAVSLAGRGAGPEALVGRLTATTLAFVLPGRDVNEARRCAESLRRLVTAAPVDAAGTPLSISATFGVASLSGPDAMEQAIAAADTALTEARRMGGNMVIACARCGPAALPALATVSAPPG